jgi:hypothetical protein
LIKTGTGNAITANQPAREKETEIAVAKGMETAKETWVPEKVAAEKEMVKVISTVTAVPT